MSGKYPKGTSKYTYQELHSEALKYNHPSDFRKHATKYYKASCRLGILDEIQSHMTSSKHFWTVDELAEEAKKFTTRKAFRTHNDSAYTIAWRLGVLDDICVHMVKGKNGFDKNKPADIYFYRINGGILGYGITNDFNTRKQEHSRKGLELRYEVEFLSKFRVSGKEAYKLERHLKENYPLVGLTDYNGFKTENTHIVFYKEIIRKVIHGFT